MHNPFKKNKQELEDLEQFDDDYFEETPVSSKDEDIFSGIDTNYNYYDSNYDLFGDNNPQIIDSYPSELVDYSNNPEEKKEIEQENYEEYKADNNFENGYSDYPVEDFNDFQTNDFNNYNNTNLNTDDEYGYDDEYESNLDKEKAKEKNNFYKKIINICFTVIILLLIVVSIDIIGVSRYNVGPFFVVNTKTYNDGGTKEYTGIGYKVIKYNQVQGRRDMELGSWSIKYNTNPIDIEDIDLAIEFENNKEETSKKYYRRFLRLQSTIKKVDTKNNKLILEYKDLDNKYTLDIHCSMADKNSNIAKFKKNQKINILGTETKFEIKNKKSPNKVYIENCFAQGRD